MHLIIIAKIAIYYINCIICIVLNVIIVIATYQGREGVDQMVCLNCDKGGGVPKYEAKTIQREPLDIIILKRKFHSWILPLETQRI